MKPKKATSARAATGKDTDSAEGADESGRGTNARAIWTGSISFGLVNVPVRLYPATHSHQLPFHQFDAKSLARVRYKRVIEGTEEEVPYAQIVDGYEVKKGQIVTLSDEEMAAAEPKKSRSLEIEQFVPLEEIDPVTWNHTYYVLPDDATGPRKAYAVLRDAMQQMGRVAIGRLVMRTKQYLATLRPFASGLALETMFFADEIRAFPAGAGRSTLPAGSAREVEMAKKLIEAFAEPWHHDRYQDTYRDSLLALIKRKAKGQVVEVAPPPEREGQVIDLMEALKKSLGGVPGEKSAGTTTRNAERSGHTRAPSSRRRAGPARSRSRKTAA